MSNSYEDKKQARIDRYTELASKNRAESQRLYEESTKMISALPPGQPLLTDHYSYKSDRNYRDRAFNKMGKSVEANDKAAYYANKAAAAESNTAISSDDPEALPKLKERLAELQARQEQMKAANKYYRDHKTMQGYPGLSDEAAAQVDERIQNSYSWARCPAPSYSLQNNNANIRRIKERIAGLERNQEVGFVGWEFDGGRVVANAEENRLQIYFDEKPDEAKRTAMKGQGFHYSKFNNHAWQRQLNYNAIYAASRLDFALPASGISPCKLQPRAQRKELPQQERER